MSEEDRRAFVRSFVHYLKKQINNDPSSDMAESLEVAIQCLEAAYDIISSNDDAVATTSTKEPEIDLYQLFQTAYFDINPDKKQDAETVKNEGNRLMKEGKYQEALIHYNKALILDATNPVFYCNRAAAYIRLNEFDKAITDCKMSLIYNPNYSKAYGRMGIAYFNLMKYEQSRDTYKKALELEPDNQDYQNNLRLAEEKLERGGLEALIFSNPDIRNSYREFLNDPNIAMVLQQLLRNPGGILDTSHELVQRMMNERHLLINAARLMPMFSTFRGLINQNGTTNNNDQQQQQPEDGCGSGGINLDSSQQQQQQQQQQSVNVVLNNKNNPVSDGKRVTASTFEGASSSPLTELLSGLQGPSQNQNQDNNDGLKFNLGVSMTENSNLNDNANQHMHHNPSNSSDGDNK